MLDVFGSLWLWGSLTQSVLQEQGNPRSINMAENMVLTLISDKLEKGLEKCLKLILKRLSCTCKEDAWLLSKLTWIICTTLLKNGVFEFYSHSDGRGPMSFAQIHVKLMTQTVESHAYLLGRKPS